MDIKPDASPYQLQKTFEQETTQYEWSRGLDFSRLRATDNVIREAPDGNVTFSTTMWDLCFPKFPPGALWHNTSIEVLRSIAGHREIRLHTLKSRVPEGELTTFARQHGLDGYLTSTESGGHRSVKLQHEVFCPSAPPLVQGPGRVIDTLAGELFYLSLTASEETGHWSFGDVRLRLRVGLIQKRAELRQMKYASLDGTLSNPFSVLKGVAERQFNRVFIPSGLSRVGAFFLPFYFEDEMEVRLLIKKYGECDQTQVLHADATGYIAVPIDGEHERVKIDVLEVQNRNRSLDVEVAEIAALLNVKHTQLED